MAAIKLKTTKQIGASVGRHFRTVRYHCERGKLPGAELIGGTWLVPAKYADPSVYQATVGDPGRKAKASK